MNNIIMAHRGIYNNINIPENSILAFKKALKYNYSIELDIQMTKDNVIVVFHDDNLKRMTRLNNNISSMTYNEIKSLYLLNTKEKIPTLEEVLKLIGNKVLINIEIKYNKNYKLMIDNLYTLLNKYKGNYLIQSFNIKILLYLKKNYPNIKRGILISNNKNKFIKYLHDIININLSKPSFISISKRLLNKKKYIKLINKNKTFIWTIKTKDELNIYLDRYYGYICDNLPYKKS